MDAVSAKEQTLKFIDLFCGIGGFHLAAEEATRLRGRDAECVLASDIDPDARRSYEANFGIKPAGDIRKISADHVPDHDVLFAGFPCQPFSIIGEMRGFEDTRGTLFFEIARLLVEKRPKAFVLENVKMLAGHDKGRTLRVILQTLRELGYYTDYRVLNALDFGLPQKRERVFIVGFSEPMPFLWPRGGLKRQPLADILQPDVPDFYRASPHIRKRRQELYDGRKHSEPTIWHENKGGHISAYPYSCALRAGASYNYLLVDGERRLTEREMLRLQGFPDAYKIVGNYQTVRKQAGNAVAVPCVAAVVGAVVDALQGTAPIQYNESTRDGQPVMLLMDSADLIGVAGA